LKTFKEMDDEQGKTAKQLEHANKIGCLSLVAIAIILLVLSLS